MFTNDVYGRSAGAEGNTAPSPRASILLLPVRYASCLKPTENGDTRPPVTDVRGRKTTEDGDSAGIPRTKTKGFRGIPGDSRGFQQEDHILRVPSARIFLGLYE